MALALNPAGGGIFRLPEKISGSQAMMIESGNTVVRQFNNDILSHFATFQARQQEKEVLSAAASTAASAAVALPATPPPSPASLDDAEVEQTVNMIAGEAQNASIAINNVHTGLDPDRVARLLGLLD